MTETGPTTHRDRPSRRLFKEPDWNWVQTGEVGWWVRPGWGETLIGPRGLRLDEWKSCGKLVEVKRGPQRIVYRADLPEGSVYIKHFLVPGWREMLRQWFRRGKGRNEGKRAARLATHGIETIEPVALGEQRRRRFLFENYLVSPSLQGLVPLDHFLENQLEALPEPRRSRVRRNLARALGSLTARLHATGLYHADYHPGNLLLRIEADDRPRLAMIDLDALRYRRHLSLRSRILNLAVLNHYFWIRCNRADRTRFLRAYLAEATTSLGAPERAAREIESTTRRWAERLWRRWGRRCTHSNKYFRAWRAPHGWLIQSRSVDSDIAERVLQDPDAPLNDPSTTILKTSRTTTVGELTWTVDGKPRRVIYKRFNQKKGFEPLLTLFRPSRGWRSWRAGHHLSSRGLPTPPNLLIMGRTAPNGQKSRWPAPSTTYLATLKVEPSTTLADFFLETYPSLDPAQQRSSLRNLTRALGRLLRTLHHRSLSDRDLKASNILIEGDPLADEPRLSLIDLVGVTLKDPLPRSRQIQNLSRLHLSVSQLPGWNQPALLRLLHEYLGMRADQPKVVRSYWIAVCRRGKRKVEQNRRRGRVLS